MLVKDSTHLSEPAYVVNQSCTIAVFTYSATMSLFIKIASPVTNCLSSPDVRL